MATPSQYLLLTVKVGALENLGFSDKQNPNAVCYHIDRQLEALSAY